VESYYDMLEVAPTATADEIKRAFRREIARYHPDKVQHLGREFQEIAAVKASELTRAYKVLSDGALRADYDAQLKAAVTPPHGPAPSPLAQDASPRAETTDRSAHSGAAAASPEPSSGRAGAFSRERAGASDLVRRAVVVRFRQALNEEFGQCEEAPLQGFDVACVPPKGGFLSRSVPPRMLGRFVAQVDAASVQESWSMASRMKRDDQRDLCVFIMGPAVAPAGELGRAIVEQRRKPMPAGGKLVMVPVNTRTWAAHIPNDAPPAVKALLTRLQSS
jgi:curved DNA-binding protein CbpA